jgi:hypothetical protein
MTERIVFDPDGMRAWAREAREAADFYRLAQGLCDEPLPSMPAWLRSAVEAARTGICGGAAFLVRELEETAGEVESRALEAERVAGRGALQAGGFALAGLEEYGERVSNILLLMATALEAGKVPLERLLAVEKPLAEDLEPALKVISKVEARQLLALEEAERELKRLQAGVMEEQLRETQEIERRLADVRSRAALAQRLTDSFRTRIQELTGELSRLPDEAARATQPVEDRIARLAGALRLAEAKAAELARDGERLEAALKQLPEIMRPWALALLEGRVHDLQEAWRAAFNWGVQAESTIRTAERMVSRVEPIVEKLRWIDPSLEDALRLLRFSDDVIQVLGPLKETPFLAAAAFVLDSATFYAKHGDVLWSVGYGGIGLAAAVGAGVVILALPVELPVAAAAAITISVVVIAATVTIDAQAGYEYVYEHRADFFNRDRWGKALSESTSDFKRNYWDSRSTMKDTAGPLGLFEAAATEPYAIAAHRMAADFGLSKWTEGWV